MLLFTTGLLRGFLFVIVPYFPEKGLKSFQPVEGRANVVFYFPRGIPWDREATVFQFLTCLTQSNPRLPHHQIWTWFCQNVFCQWNWVTAEQISTKMIAILGCRGFLHCAEISSANTMPTVVWNRRNACVSCCRATWAACRWWASLNWRRRAAPRWKTRRRPSTRDWRRAKWRTQRSRRPATGT